MSSITQSLSVLRWTTRSAFADFAAIYTWRTYLFGWLVRILAQVLFYGLIGITIGSAEAVAFLVVGNAVFVGVTVCLAISASTTWERRAGTIPLVIASPTPLALVIAGRSVQWIVDGMIVSTISLLGLAPLLGVAIDWWGTLAALPVVLLILLSTYGLGLSLAAISLRVPAVRNAISALVGLVLAIACGVQVPTSFWPEPVGLIGQVMPITHGLVAVRSLVAGRWDDVLEQVALEAAVGAGYWALGLLVFAGVVRGVRRRGTLLD